MGMKEEVDWEFVRNRALRHIIVEQIKMAHPPVSFKQAQTIYMQTFPNAEQLEAYKGRAVIYTGDEGLPPKGDIIRAPPLYATGL